MWFKIPFVKSDCAKDIELLSRDAAYFPILERVIAGSRRLKTGNQGN